jgi:hypothetical protein
LRILAFSDYRIQNIQVPRPVGSFARQIGEHGARQGNERQGRIGACDCVSIVIRLGISIDLGVLVIRRRPLPVLTPRRSGIARILQMAAYRELRSARPRPEMFWSRSRCGASVTWASFGADAVFYRCF